jgi:hypothetical protein
MLCAVAEEAQGRGAYVAAARALRAALAPRCAPPLPRAPPTPGSDGGEPLSRRDNDDDDDALSGDSGEDYDSGGDDDADDSARGSASGRPRVRVAHIPLAFLPLGRAALVLPPGSAAAEAPLATPGAQPHARSLALPA